MGTREPSLLSVSSLEDAVSRLEDIKSVFDDKGLLVLRGYKFEPREQLRLVALLGDHYGWNICTDRVGQNPTSEKADEYLFHAGGSDNPNRDIGLESDYSLDWHIEQVFYVHPVLGATWNMYEFTSDPMYGQTHFVDSIELYNLFSDDDKDFLSKSVVKWDKSIGPKSGFGPYFSNVVGIHPNRKEAQLRVETDGGCIIAPTLHSYDGQEPTKAQKSRYDRLYRDLRYTLHDNLDIRYIQKWQQDDMVIVDLYRMYHAVTDGFGFGSRKMRGAFLRPKDYDATLYTSMEQLS